MTSPISNPTEERAQAQAQGRVNPVEALFLAGVSLLFFSSLYNLVYVKQSTLVKFDALQSKPKIVPIHAPELPNESLRTPAAVSETQAKPLSLQVNLPCAKDDLILGSSATHLTIHGSACPQGISEGTNDPLIGVTLVQASEDGHSTQELPTLAGFEFETPVIELAKGSNQFSFEFRYKSGAITKRTMKLEHFAEAPRVPAAASKPAPATLPEN